MIVASEDKSKPAGDASEPKAANQRGAARLAAVQALYQMDVVGTGVLEIAAEYALGERGDQCRLRCGERVGAGTWRALKAQRRREQFEHRRHDDAAEDDAEDQCDLLQLDSPVLSNAEFEAMRHVFALG